MLMTSAGGENRRTDGPKTTSQARGDTALVDAKRLGALGGLALLNSAPLNVFVNEPIMFCLFQILFGLYLMFWVWNLEMSSVAKKWRATNNIHIMQQPKHRWVSQCLTKSHGTHCEPPKHSNTWAPHWKTDYLVVANVRRPQNKQKHWKTTIWPTIKTG